MVHRLEAEYWNEVDFVYIDREAPGNRDVVRAFGIAYQPVFVLVNPDGTEVTRWTVLPEESIRAELDSYLAAR